MAAYTLTGLADENESVRDAALGAGHVLVEHYATTYVLVWSHYFALFFLLLGTGLKISFCSHVSQMLFWALKTD